MNEIIKTILSRVLSEELGRQQAWLEEDEKFGDEFIAVNKLVDNRKEVIATIEAFMDENGIEHDNSFKMRAYKEGK